jgi:hypothetical protein
VVMVSLPLRAVAQCASYSWTALPGHAANPPDIRLPCPARHPCPVFLRLQPHPRQAGGSDAGPASPAPGSLFFPQSIITTACHLPCHRRITCTSS